jgi:hypothetical protein
MVTAAHRRSERRLLTGVRQGPLAMVMMQFAIGAVADVLPLASVGGNLVAQAHTRVSLSEQEVTIIADRRGYSATCQFCLLCDSCTDSMDVGFPDMLTEQGLGPGTSLADFSCMVDGTPALLSYRPARRMALLRGWFLWRVGFGGRKQQRVCVSYRGVYSPTGQVAYVLGTGRNWEGPIRQGRVVFNHGKVAGPAFVRSFCDLAGQARFHKVTRYEDSVVVEFVDLEPSTDTLKVAWTVFLFWDTAEVPGAERNMRIAFDTSSQRGSLYTELRGMLGRPRGNQQKWGYRELYDDVVSRRGCTSGWRAAERVPNGSFLSWIGQQCDSLTTREKLTLMFLRRKVQADD